MKVSGVCGGVCVCLRAYVCVAESGERERESHQSGDGDEMWSPLARLVERF